MFNMGLDSRGSDMLKRISKIKGVGTYAECNAGGIELHKTALIFGYNSYGKSTLSDILRSIETRDTGNLVARQTIPGPVAQKVVLSFGADSGPEIPLCMENGSWQPVRPGNFEVRVFDSGFTARNLFSGAHAERSNREAFSRFVLGEQGVAKASQIAELRRKLAATKSSSRKLHKQLESVGDVDAFVTLEVSEKSEVLKTELAPLMVELAQAKRQLASYDEIQNRALLDTVRDPDGDLALLHKLNVALGASLETAHGVVRDKVLAHVRAHMRADKSANEWLSQGVSFIASSHCPFCEQPLNNSPAGLIDSYKKYFDAAFREQSAKIIAQLNEYENVSLSWGLYSQARGVEKNAAVLAAYRELDQDGAFQGQKREFDIYGERVKESRKRWGAAFVSLREFARDAIRSKRAAPYESVDAMDLKAFLEAHAELTNALADFNGLCTKVNETLVAFKARSGKESLDVAITRLNEAVQAKELRIRRVDSDGTCKAYKEAKVLDAELDVAIANAQANLNLEQSEYLNKFFERINYYFGQFGGKHFSIGKEEELDNQGYHPVLSLVIRYNGVVVAPAKVGVVFSDSDRRALALSIYWAKMSVLTDAERANTIAVLDDPVTSFDDNRISAAIMLMRTEALSLRQLVIFTHYHAFAKRWLEVERVCSTLSFHQLVRNETTTNISEADELDFLHTEQHKLYRKVVDFIGRRTNEPIGIDLRVYLENEIRDRYRQQISNLGLQSATLSDVINKLEETGELASDVAKKAHFFREDLNGPHHILTARGREDWSSLASMMLTFIYTKL